MPGTTAQQMHFKNFMSHGTLCGSDEETDLVTLHPEKVTCSRCLAAMGRSTPAEPDQGSRAE